LGILELEGSKVEGQPLQQKDKEGRKTKGEKHITPSIKDVLQTCRKHHDGIKTHDTRSAILIKIHNS